MRHMPTIEYCDICADLNQLGWINSTDTLHICMWCLLDRACRILGHTEPSPIDGTCYRCDVILEEEDYL